MSVDHKVLKYREHLLDDAEKRLAKIRREFIHVGDRKKELHGVWGSDDIAGAMGAFVDNWDHYRGELLGKVESVGMMVAATRKGFRDLEKRLEGRLKDRG